MALVIALVKPTAARFALAGTWLLAAALGARAAVAKIAPERDVLAGLRVDGEAVPARVATEGELRAWIAARGDARLARHVVLVASDDPRRVLDEGALADFGARVDVEPCVARAIALGRADDPLERALAATRAKRGEIDVPLGFTIDAGVAADRVRRVKRAEDTAPVAARVDLDHHTVVPEREGRYVDVDGAIASLARAAASAEGKDGDAVQVPVAHVPPRFTRASLAGLDVHAVLASFDTYFSRRGDQERRGKNIDVAAAHLDGLVLEPGALFSFNAAVGDRSEENGFQRSWEINKGEMVEGIGGGTCQVASTFHAAAYFAGLEVLQRLPHSRPSAYIPMGLDATVVYPDVDLKIRNPYDFPIAVHAKVDGNKLRVELLGARRPARVEYRREIVEALPYEREVDEDERLRGDVVRVKQHGIAGFKIEKTRLLTFADGHVKKEETNDRYPPTTEIDEVPVGFDATRLPALPDAPPIADDAPPPPTPTPPQTPPQTPPPPLTFVETPGAHPPTEAQASPPRLFTLHR
jgi:vancomycin resistance protein YoaR